MSHIFGITYKQKRNKLFINFR